MPHLLLTLLLLSLPLLACTSLPGPRGAAGAGSPAGPVVVAISGPVVDATTGAPVVAPGH